MLDNNNKKDIITCFIGEFMGTETNEKSVNKDYIIKVREDSGEVRDITLLKGNIEVVKKAFELQFYDEIEITFKVDFIKEIDSEYTNKIRRHSKGASLITKDFEVDKVKLEVIDIQKIDANTLYKSDYMIVKNNYHFGKLKYIQAKDSAREESKYILFYDELVSRANMPIKIIAHQIKVEFNKTTLIEKLASISGHPEIEIVFKIHLNASGQYAEILDVDII